MRDKGRVLFQQIAIHLNDNVRATPLTFVPLWIKARDGVRYPTPPRSVLSSF